MKKLNKLSILIFFSLNANEVMASSDFYKFIGTEYVYDDNFLKIDNQNTDNIISSDSIFKTSVGFGYKQKNIKNSYGAEISFSKLDYANNSYLDTVSYKSDVFWLTSFSRAISNQFFLSSEKYTTNFGPVLQTEKNEITKNSYGNEIKINLNNNLKSDLGIVFTDKKNSSEQNSYLDSKQYSIYLKNTYVFNRKVKSKLDLNKISLKPIYENQGLSASSQESILSGIEYTPSLKLGFGFYVGKLRYHDELNRNSFDKVNYSTKFDWKLSNKSNLNLSFFSYDLVPETEYSTYTTSQGGRIEYLFNSLNKFRIKFYYNRSQDKSDLTVNQEYFETSSTNTQLIGSELLYKITTKINLSLKASRISKESDIYVNNYSSNKIQLGLRVNF